MTPGIASLFLSNENFEEEQKAKEAAKKAGADDDPMSEPRPANGQ